MRCSDNMLNIITLINGLQYVKVLSSHIDAIAVATGINLMVLNLTDANLLLSCGPH